MLTKELLEVTKYKPNISPEYREIEEYREVAEKVIAAYRQGRTRGEIEQQVSNLETHDTFKLVRGLSKLLERRATFKAQSEAPPDRLRRAAFERGFVTDRDERDAVLEAVGTEFDIAKEEVERGLWADRDENEVLTSTPDREPAQLLKQYNLSLTQTLLFDAFELEFTASGNYQEIFSRITYLGLMYTVDPDLTVTVTGPASLFKKTRKYGTELAKLIPSIMKAEEWSLSAQVETEVSNETRVYEFSLNSDKGHLFPEKAESESYDSEVERDFATRISSLAENWTVKREPTILRANNRVMIPDFSFERNEYEFYLEVVGFWTPEYLEEKIEKVQAVETEKPIVLAVNETLNCTKEDFDEADHVFFYDKQIPVKPVVSRLKIFDNKIVEDDLKTLNDQQVDPPDEAMSIKSYAKMYDVETESMERYLKDTGSGTISSGTYLPDSAIDELEKEIQESDGSNLSDVNPILERYGVGQDILEEIGYSIQYVSLNQDEATLVEK